MQLAPFAVLDQLGEPTSDAGPDENAVDNCFVASPAMMINYLTGSALTGDALLDAIYPGDSYSGGGDSWAPAALAVYAQHGCSLDAAHWANDTNVADVLAYVRSQLDAGHPVLVTWPSQWGIQTRDTARGYHAVVCIGYDAASYTYANPWGGEIQTYDAQWSADRLVNAGAMWRAAMDISQVSAYFTAVDAAHWQCKQTLFTVQLGILKFYASMPAAGGLAGLTALGLPTSNELYPRPGIAVQHFERGVVVYDPLRAFDTPPGATGDCYIGHVSLAFPPQSAPDPTLAAKASAYDRMMVDSKIA